MATLQNIRNRGPVIAVVIGIALLAFLLGDINKIFSSGNSQDVAEVNGKEVSLKEYQNRYKNYEQGFKMITGQSTMSEQNAKYVKSQVWDKIIKGYSLSDTYEELGIDVTGMEIAKIISGENMQNGLDPLTKQVFSDKNGQFNSQAAVNFFSTASQTEDKNAIANFLESEIKDNRKFTKFASLITKGINTTKFEAKKLFAERTKLVDFNYATKKYSSIADSTISVSDSELDSYYSAHKDEYKQKESRDIAYVTFNIIPSEEDKNETKKDLNYYKKDFKEVAITKKQEELVNFVNANSEQKFSFKHLSFNDIKDSALFYANSDVVFGPLYENGSYVMKRVFDRVNMVDSVKARHILIQPDGQVIKDMDKAKEVADSLLNLIKNGADFAQVAKDNSVYKVTGEKGGELGMIDENAMLNQLGNEFTDECFASKKGELKIIETGYGIHIAEILDKSKGETEKVRLAIVSQLVRAGNTTMNNYFAKARDFANASKSIEDFNANIEKEGLTKRIANKIEPSTEVIAGIENAGTIINWIYKDDTKKGTVSSAFQDPSKFVVAIITEVREEGIAPLEIIKDAITSKVVKQKKADKFAKEMASITDLPKEAKNISFSSARLNNDGIEYSVIATAVNSEKDKVSKPIIGENGVYVIKVSSVTGGEVKDDIDLSNDINNAQRRSQFRVSRELFDALKEATNVVDNRHKYL